MKESSFDFQHKKSTKLFYGITGDPYFDYDVQYFKRFVLNLWFPQVYEYKNKKFFGQ